MRTRFFGLLALLAAVIITQLSGLFASTVHAATKLLPPPAPKILYNADWRPSEPLESGETKGNLDYASSWGERAIKGAIWVRNNSSEPVDVTGMGDCPARHDPEKRCWEKDKNPKFSFTVQPGETVRVEGLMCGQWDFNTPNEYGRFFGFTECEEERLPTPTATPTATSTPAPTGTATSSPTPRATDSSQTATPEASATATPESTMTPTPQTATATPVTVTYAPPSNKVVAEYACIDRDERKLGVSFGEDANAKVGYTTGVRVLVGLDNTPNGEWLDRGWFWRAKALGDEAQYPQQLLLGHGQPVRYRIETEVSRAAGEGPAINGDAIEAWAGAPEAQNALKTCKPEESSPPPVIDVPSAPEASAPAPSNDAPAPSAPAPAPQASEPNSPAPSASPTPVPAVLPPTGVEDLVWLLVMASFSLFALGLMVHGRNFRTWTNPFARVALGFTIIGLRWLIKRINR